MNIPGESIIDCKLNAHKRSFIIKYKESGSGGEKDVTFAIPKRITLWQIGEINRIIADLFEHCKDTGKILAAALVTFVKTGDVDVLKNTATGVMAASSGDLFQGAMSGAGDIFKFFSTERIVEIMTVLFLLPGEWGIPAEKREEEFKNRANIFMSLPSEVIWGGIKDFFGSRLSQLKDSPSLSSIFGSQKKNKSTESSGVSTETLTITEGSSMPSPMDTPNGSSKSSE